MDDPVHFRLSLNKPAAERIFGEARAMRVRMVPDLAIKATAECGGSDWAPLEERAGGGLGATIEGSEAGKLLAALHARRERPFYRLREVESGWWQLQHWDAEKAPARHWPVLRVWLSLPSPAATRIGDDIGTEFGAFAVRVRKAKAVVVQHTGSVGRPSHELAEARRTLEMFWKLAAEIGENRDTALVEEAIALLSQFLGKPS